MCVHHPTFYDPLTVLTTERLIAGNPHAWAIQGDLRDPNEFLYHGQVVEHLDFDQPVAVLAVAVLHHIPDADHPAALVNRIAAYLVTDSYLVLSHVAPETTTEDNARLRASVRLYEQTGTPVVPRSAEEIAALLGDAFEILPPGVSAADQWLRRRTLPLPAKSAGGDRPQTPDRGGGRGR